MCVPILTDELKLATNVSAAMDRVWDTPWALSHEDLQHLTTMEGRQLQKEVLKQVEVSREHLAQMLRKAATVERRAEIKRTRQAILDLLFVHNAAAKIHAKLPNELLQAVFAYIGPTHRRHIHATHVCRIWRVFIRQNVPAYWADFLSAPKMYAARKADESPFLLDLIGRSHPLTHGLSLTSKQVGFLPPDAQPFSRVSSLTLRVRLHHITAVNRFLTLSMPSLEHLNMRFVCQSDFPNMPRLTDNDLDCSHRFPLLRHVTVSAVFLPFSIAVKSITRLELLDCPDDCQYHLATEVRPWHTDDFVAWIRRCPDLEYLKITHSAPDDVIGEEIVKPALHLPKLRECVIEDEDGEYAYKMLQALTFPPHTHLTFLTRTSRMEDCFPTESLKDCLHALDRLVLTVTREDQPELPWPCFYLQGYVEGTERLSVIVEDACLTYNGSEQCSEVLRDFSALFADSRNVTSLDVQLPEDLHGHEDDWSAVLDGFPLLRTLSVGGDFPRELLASLRRPHACLDLTELRIPSVDWSAERDAVLPILQSRRKSGKPLVLVGTGPPGQGGSPNTEAFIPEADLGLLKELGILVPQRTRL
ncbi:hypothetical protein C8Q76DRAFT_831055 [Earliella scabrosa]|nr:hypothetical protein C8Q76DRAFT_831055 [Earliella scabrosa]